MNFLTFSLDCLNLYNRHCCGARITIEDTLQPSYHRTNTRTKFFHQNIFYITLQLVKWCLFYIFIQMKIFIPYYYYYYFFFENLTSIQISHGYKLCHFSKEKTAFIIKSIKIKSKLVISYFHCAKQVSRNYRWFL